MEKKPSPYAGTQKHKVKTYAILSCILKPVGGGFFCIAIILLITGIPNLLQGLKKMEKVEQCMQTASKAYCSYGMTAEYSFGIFALSSGGVLALLGLASFIAGVLFSLSSRAKRAEDIAKGIDYSTFPYGK